MSVSDITFVSNPVQMVCQDETSHDHTVCIDHRYTETGYQFAKVEEDSKGVFNNNNYDPYIHYTLARN